MQTIDIKGKMAAGHVVKLVGLLVDGGFCLDLHVAGGNISLKADRGIDPGLERAATAIEQKLGLRS